jgi:putative ABC transport system permease protein
MLRQDLKQALRGFQKNPGFVFTAIVTLALGIGANTAVFSVVDAVLLKPIPFPDPDRLVMFTSIFPQGSGPAASPAKFQHFREQTSVTQDISAFRPSVVNYTSGEFPEQLRLGQVSADFFRLFGASIILGRSFLPEEDLPRGPHVALISQRLWIRRFGGDRGMIGKTISLSGEPYVVVGIVSSSFDTNLFALTPEVWIPFQLDPNTTDQGHYFFAAGRLKPGIKLQQA